MVNREKPGFAESASISGFADVWNGKWYLKHGKNHILTNGLLCMATMYGVNDNWYYGYFYSTGNVMQVGTDTTTATNFSMTALISPLASSSSITYPNSVSSQGAPNINSANNTVNINVTATWNAGALGSNTFGEFGLFAGNTGSYGLAPGAGNLLTRIASADGTFSAFTINTSYPVVISYTVQINYV